MVFRRTFLVAAIALGAVGDATGAGAITINDATAAAAGGIANYFDSGNTFPNVVELIFSNSTCTGTLINSRTILTAAHCVTASNGVTNTVSAGDSVAFTPVAGVSGAPGTIAITGAVRSPIYAQTVTVSGDIAMVSLATPVTNTPFVTLMQPSQPIPAVGTVLTMVGYGLAGTGSTGAACTNGVCLPGTLQDDKRRISMTELGYYGPANLAPVVLGTSTQAFYMAQFRNPLSPGNPDSFGLNAMGIPTQTLEGGVASGDSGGPLFANIGGVMIEIGEVSGGANNTGGPTSGYGDVNQWTPVALFSTWIAQNNPLRQMSSNAGNFNWSNPAAWSDSVAGVTAQVPNNTVGNVNGFLNVANYFNVTLANTGTITTDISPTIDSLSIAGAGAQLSIAPNTTLTTVVGSQMTAGAMAVGGAFSTQALALSGGTLSGTGTVTATGSVGNTGGTIAPGSAIALGTLTIQGNYTQSGTGTLTIRLASATSDQLTVGGAVSLGGILALAGQGQPYKIGFKYTVLTANTLSGAFASVTGSQVTDFLAATPTYLANSVQVGVAQNVSFTTVATTPNQIAAAKALDKAAATATGNLAQAANDLANSSAANAANGLNQLAADGGGSSDGDVVGNYLTGNLAAAQMVGHALDQHIAMLRDDSGGAAAAVGALGLQRNMPGHSLGQIAQAVGGAVADGGAGVPSGPPLKFWAQGIGAWQSLRDDGETPGMLQSIGGLIAGVDARPFAETWPNLKGGVAFSYTSGSLSGDDETGMTNAYRLALYATNNWGPAFVEGRVGYGYDEISTSRYISFDGLDLTPTAETHGHEWSTRVAAGYGLDLYGIHLEPNVGLAFDQVTRNGYTESGAGDLGLVVDSSSLESLVLSAGARAATSIDLWNGLVLRPAVEARYEDHMLRELPATDLAFIGAPDDGFEIIGARPGSNAALLDGGFTIGNGGCVAGFADYTADLRAHQTVQAVVGGLRVTW